MIADYWYSSCARIPGAGIIARCGCRSVSAGVRDLFFQVAGSAIGKRLMYRHLTGNDD